ncbi:MAG: hypothetical protein ACOX3K_02735 [Bacilli bacterium]|jgi:hypothetical protein
MRKNKKTFLFVGLTTISLLLSGCKLLDLFNQSSNDNSSLVSQGDESEVSYFELGYSYALVGVRERHAPPCDYEGTHETSPSLALIAYAYNTMEITFEPASNTQGFVYIHLPESVEESDTFFTVRTGDYTLSEDKLTITDGTNTMELTFEEDNLVYSIMGVSQVEGHQGHDFTLSLIFADATAVPHN